MSFCSQNLLLTNMVCRGVGKVEGEDIVCTGRRGRYSLHWLNKIAICNSNRLLVNKLTK